MENIQCKYDDKLVGRAFEELSLEEMAASQGGVNPLTSSVPCLKTVTISSGWCSAGVIVSTIVYSVMKC
ncbi:lichenicidin A2 family type 2 lantibiotic [Proteiniborus sp.]|uniref:lichenicidin A2 family type 2 lantibiotic n=1 Tax=Proteiniborus sp. TaxID=2079015 RepID=UPI0033319FFC